MRPTPNSPEQRYDADPMLSYRARIRAAEAAANPLLEAARPLLDALANTPAELEAADVARHRQALIQHLRLFEKICSELKLPADQVEQARYCLCSALDEAAGKTPWGNGSRAGLDWSATGLATTFGFDRQGGDRVYAIATDAVRNPGEHHDLIEVIQHILQRGFQGRYRFLTDGDNRAAAVHEQIAQAVTQHTPSPRIASPSTAITEDAGATNRVEVTRSEFEERPESIARQPSRHWQLASVLCLLLIAIAAVVAYGRYTPVGQTRSAVAPLDALATRLSDDLAGAVNAGTVTISLNAQHTSLTIGLEGIFDAGESSVNPWVKPIIATIGRESANTPGTVVVTGHTDNQPFAQMQQRSNIALSEARAQAVVQILAAAGLLTERIHANGKGEAEPAADNGTPQGRMRNRRVDITLTK